MPTSATATRRRASDVATTRRGITAPHGLPDITAPRATGKPLTIDADAPVVLTGASARTGRSEPPSLRAGYRPGLVESAPGNIQVIVDTPKRSRSRRFSSG